MTRWAKDRKILWPIIRADSIPVVYNQYFRDCAKSAPYALLAMIFVSSLSVRSVGLRISSSLVFPITQLTKTRTVTFPVYQVSRDVHGNSTVWTRSHHPSPSASISATSRTEWLPMSVSLGRDECLTTAPTAIYYRRQCFMLICGKSKMMSMNKLCPRISGILSTSALAGIHFTKITPWAFYG